VAANAVSSAGGANSASPKFLSWILRVISKRGKRGEKERREENATKGMEGKNTPEINF